MSALDGAARARALVLLLLGCAAGVEAADPAVRFSVRYGEGLVESPQTGRLLLMLARHDGDEPRFLVGDGLDTQLVFGRDVQDWEVGQAVAVDATHPGYPIESLADVPPGTYHVQALLNRYHRYTLGNGLQVSLPPDRGEGQQWARKPGNLYSAPRPVTIGADGASVEVVLDRVIAPVEAPADTPYVRHVRLRSRLLSEFWGEDVFLGAHVLLPHGFDEHPEVRYPFIVNHGHFPADFDGFRTTPPDAAGAAAGDGGEEDYAAVREREAWAFYQRWTGPDFPRFVIVKIQHPTPYYDDSYAVNSAAQGPWGDAINYELLPYLEGRFRGIGEGWARFTYGGSTGGWEALATQVFYPELYNGVFAACPDAVDFRAFQLVDLYGYDNAYFYASDFKRAPIPGRRDYLGNVDSSIYDQNRLELVLGGRSRSGGQWDAWEATFSPLGADGYPQRIWDKATGEIDHAVAAWWREHYDLRYILERDWATLGPKLVGKLHVFVGDMDSFHLNNAVYLLEQFLRGTDEPHFAGEIDYGDRAEHCWNGDHANPNRISRLRYHTLYVDRILRRIEASAPPGADLTSWRY